MTETQQTDPAVAAATRSVEAEVARLQDISAQQGAKLPALDRDQRAAEKAEARAWAKMVKAGEPNCGPVFEAWTLAHTNFARAQAAYERVFDGIRSNQDRIDRVRSNRELAKRTTTYGRINTMAATATKSNKKTAKDLGVPDVYLGPNGAFYPGGDARLKSDLILAILEQDAPDAKMEWSKADAMKLFKKFPQWAPFLTRKEEILKAKADKAASKQAEKAATAKAKADAKKAKAAAASDGNLEEQVAAEQADYDASTAVDVTPDPKPTRKPRASRKVQS
jgi:hypothetical protein